MKFQKSLMTFNVTAVPNHATIHECGLDNASIKCLSLMFLEIKTDMLDSLGPVYEFVCVSFTTGISTVLG